MRESTRVVLPRERFAQEGPKLRFLVQQVEGRLWEALVRVKEMVDLAAG